jgi:hypothetical protein
MPLSSRWGYKSCLVPQTKGGEVLGPIQSLRGSERSALVPNSSVGEGSW